MKISVQICEICGQTGQGNHFGVISCRACAAFFRRAANSKWSKLKCLSRNCDGKTYHCKPCRLKRCREVGMDTSKFQHDRDILQNSRKHRVSPTSSFENFVGCPNFILFLPQPMSKKPKTFVDFSHLVEKATEILKNGPETPWIAENQLKKLGFGVNSMKLGKELKPLRTVSRPEVTSFWEFHFLTCAKWLTYFDQFQDLDMDLKLEILFAVWHVWGRLDKLMATALYRTRNKDYKLSERIVGDGYLIDMNAAQGDISWMTDWSFPQIGYFINGIRAWDLFHIIDQLQSLSVYEEELNFMLGQLCFQYASNRFGGQIGEVLDGFQQILSNDLHHFYVNQLKMPRYLGRLTKMLKINQEIQENIRKYRLRTDVAKVFEVFNLEFSHPKMFEDTGFV